MPKQVSIDFIGDYICPWCYIAKVRLAKLKEKLAEEIQLEIHSKPYLLYPDLPQGGLPRSTFSKTGKPGLGKALKIASKEEGIRLNYKLIDRIPRTFEAHRLTWLVKDIHQQYTLATSLYQAYFENGIHLEDRTALVQIAEEIKLPEKVIDQFLNTDKGTNEAKALIENYREGGIRAVPSLQFAEGLFIQGLQPSELWERYIRRMASRN